MRIRRSSPKCETVRNVNVLRVQSQTDMITEQIRYLLARTLKFCQLSLLGLSECTSDLRRHHYLTLVVTLTTVIGELSKLFRAWQFRSIESVFFQNELSVEKASDFCEREARELQSLVLNCTSYDNSSNSAGFLEDRGGEVNASLQRDIFYIQLVESLGKRDRVLAVLFDVQCIRV